MRISSFRVLGALLLLLPAPLIAERDAMLRVSIEPGRGHWVTSPVRLRLTLEGLEPETLQWVDPASFRVRIDGFDLTDFVFAESARQGGVRFVREGRGLELACLLPLPPGEHEVSADYQVRSGGGPRFAQRFVVYAPNDVRRGLGLAPEPPRVQPVQPLSVSLPSTPPQAAPVWITPADTAFVGTAQSDLEVRWARDNAGMKLGALKILLDNQDVTSSFTVERDRAIRKSVPLANGLHTLVAQVADFDGRLRVETSSFVVFDQTQRHPWLHAPVNQPHPLAHTHQQFQNYGSGASGAYYHHGIDIRRPAGTRVLACAGGNITNFYWYGQQPYYFEVEITDQDGFRWQYHHVDEPTIPAAIRTIAAQKGYVAAGTDIGANVYWPSSAYGQRFHHIHLNVLAPDGRYINPLGLMLPLQDTTPPSVLGVWLLPQGSNTALNAQQPISGKIDIIAKAEDTIAGEPYQLSVYKTTWEVKELGNTQSHHVPETVLWQFDALPGGGDRYAKVWDVHRYSFSDGSTQHRTRGDYRYKDFYYVLSNRFQDTVDENAGYWDTAERDWRGQLRYPNGKYRLIVRAYDRRGNMGSRTLEFTLQN